MKNKIEEIYSPKAIEQLRLINELLIINVEKLEKSALASSELSKILGNGATSAKDMAQAQRELNKIQQDNEIHLKKIESLELKLQKQKEQTAKATQKQTQEEKDLQKLRSATVGSINQLIAVNNILEKRLKSVNLETEKGAKQADRLRSAIDKNNAKIKENSSALSAQRQTIGDYKSGTNQVVEAISKLDSKMTSLKGTLRNNIEQLAMMKVRGEDTTDAYRKLQMETGELKDAMMDANAEVKNMASDTKNLDGLIGVMQGVTGAFAIYQGSAALLGIENEDLEKTFVKLQATMTILNGLQQIQNLLQRESAARMLFINAKTAIQNGLESKNIIIRTASIAATKAATAAQWLLNIAMDANPVGLVIAAVALLTTGFIALRKAGYSVAESLLYVLNPMLLVYKLTLNLISGTKDYTKEQEDEIKVAQQAVDAQQKKINTLNKELAVIKKHIERMKARGATEKQLYDETLIMHDKKIQIAQEEEKLAESNWKREVARGEQTMIDLYKIAQAKAKINEAIIEKNKFIQDKLDADEKKRVEKQRQRTQQLLEEIKKLKEEYIKKEYDLFVSGEELRIKKLEDGYEKELKMVEFNRLKNIAQTKKDYDEKLKNLDKNSELYIKYQTLLKKEIEQINAEAEIEANKISKSMTKAIDPMTELISLMNEMIESTAGMESTDSFNSSMNEIQEIAKRVLKENSDIQAKILHDEKKMKDQALQEDLDRLEQRKDFAIESLNSVQKVSDAIYGREIELIDRKMSKYDQESIQYKVLAREKAELEYKQAVLNKALAITTSIINTSVGVTAALADQNYVGAVLIGIKGLAETTAIIAQPLPEIPSFKKGTDDFQGGTARFGEAGREIIELPTGQMLLANREIVANLPEHTKIHNNMKTEQILRNMNGQVVLRATKLESLMEQNNNLIAQLIKKPTKNNIFVIQKQSYLEKYKR